MPTSCITGSACSAAPPVPALDVWRWSVLPAPLPWFWAPAESCSVPGWCKGVTAHPAVPARLCWGCWALGEASAAGKLQLATKNGGFGPRGSSKRNAFGVAVPTASSSLVCLIPALPSPHQSGLELSVTCLAQKAAAAAAPPGLRETSQLLGEPGIPSLPAALPQDSHDPAVPSGSCCWTTPGKAPGMCRVRHC